MERKKEGSLELIFKSHLGNEFTNAETRIGVARSPGKKSPGRPLSSRHHAVLHDSHFSHVPFRGRLGFGCRLELGSRGVLFFLHVVFLDLLAEVLPLGQEIVLFP